MKKLISVILALVLVFSLGATAFAEGEGIGTQTATSNNSGSTKVTVNVDAANLSVTVPVSMTIVANVEGGDCAAPGNYAIVNKSALAVKVTEISVTDAVNGLTFSDTEPGATVADKGKVSIALTPTGGTKLQLTTAAITTNLGGFDMGAATNDDGVSKAIAIAAKSGMLSSTESSADAFTITFTVAAGTTTVSP